MQSELPSQKGEQKKKKENEDTDKNKIDGPDNWN